MTELRAEARVFIYVYIALMLLLGLTIASAFIDLGGFNPVVNIGIAAVKTGLIVMFFMHLNHASSLVRLFAVGGLFWLAVLFGLTLSDYFTRPGDRVLDHLAPRAVVAPEKTSE